MSEHHKVLVAVYLILKKDDQVFLTRRINTGYEDGNYTLPGGHLEAGEQPSAAAIREAKEETGIDASADDVRFVHAMHRAESNKGNKDYDDFYFICEKWMGEPKNMEPDKCDDASWFSLNQLPANTIAFVKEALQDIYNNKFYSER